MAVSVRMARTREILKHHEAARCRITDGLLVETLDQVVSLEGLTRETIRILRENKSLCVTEERQAAVELVGERAGANPIDLGYQGVKAEIDHAITTILDEKAELRELKVTLSSAPTASTPTASAPRAQPSRAAQAPVVDQTGAGVVDKIERLAELHGAGILTDTEFSKAKARLL